mgnify:CR=1 FL=1
MALALALALAIPLGAVAAVTSQGYQTKEKLPPGTLVSYGRIAAALDQPSAARAVGAAVGRNPLAYLVPCHRVIRETGIVGGYRWGQVRKRAILAWESSAHFIAES